MKKSVRMLSEEDLLGIFPIRGCTPGWFFRRLEISNGGWVVEGSDRWGRRVSRMGGDPDTLLAECEADAAQLRLDTESERP